jgi:methionyl-tRNA formyltransferase
MWCGDAANQKALAQKIHGRFGLRAVVVDTKRKQAGTATKKSLWSKLYEAYRFWPIHYSWKSMMKKYASEFSSWPNVPLCGVDTINSQEAYGFTVEQRPDLIIVSGTSLIKEPLLSIPVSIGIMNLHTGLSPYVKGGPNCTNWCIAENNWHLVGNTIMWINAGIDTGNIITTETIDIRNCRSLTEAHIEVMEHAHDLYLRCIAYVLSTEPPYSSVPQKELGEGRLYYTRMWNAEAKKKLIQNWRKRKKGDLKRESMPYTIELPKVNL